MARPLLSLQAAPPGVALFNPSVVQYGGNYYAAMRSLEKKQVGKIEWWLSDAHLCIADGDQPGFKGSSCTIFDPWKARCAGQTFLALPSSEPCNAAAHAA
jgi:hypothetical protein